MKKSIVLFLLLVFTYSFAQNEKVKLKNAEYKLGKENEFVYQLPEGMVYQDNSRVAIVYAGTQKGSVISKFVPLQKNGSDYTFSIKIPDSIHSISLAIVNSKNKVIDNNDQKGYVVYLNIKSEKEILKAKLSQLDLILDLNQRLGLKVTAVEVIDQYEELLKQNTELTKTNYYLNYLNNKYRNNKKETAPKLILFAQNLEKSKKEEDLMDAYFIYSRIDNKNKSEQILKQVIANFPKGETIQRRYMTSSYGEKNKTVTSILDSKKKFDVTFNNSTKDTDDFFYSQVLAIYLNNKDLQNIEKYENLITNKLSIRYKYNKIALELSNKDSITSAKDMVFVEKIANRALAIMDEKIKNPKELEDEFNFQKYHSESAETYAIILYKLKKYDLAFQFQEEVAKLDDLDVEGKERYAVYAEKAKGLAFSRAYLEAQLEAGVESKKMIDQLEKIHKKLNLPKNQFLKIKTAYLLKEDKKLKDELNINVSKVKAADFALTNLEGKKVKLADYKGKVVVLDFWATWCAPCRASFPAMRELITKYKKDKIAFLFIDTWEKADSNVIQKKVSKIISDNKYPFNVLYDFKDEVATQFSIKALPSKIVIDKEGNIVSTNYFISHEGLIALIEKSLKK